MPNYRLLHLNCRTGRRTKQLSDTEYLVWQGYMLSADDFGVCPASATKLQGDDPRLRAKPTKQITAAIALIISLDLVRQFTEDGETYLYQPDWQDWQSIYYPRRTSYPKPATEMLATCSETTQHLFTVHPGGVKLQKYSKKIPGIFPESFQENSKKIPDLNGIASKSHANRDKKESLRENEPFDDLRGASPAQKRDFGAAYNHPRFDVPEAWHLRRVKGLSDGEAGMLAFYRWLSARVERSNEDTEPRFTWLDETFAAWLLTRKPSSSDVHGVEETRRRYFPKRPDVAS